MKKNRSKKSRASVLWSKCGARENWKLICACDIKLERLRDRGWEHSCPIRIQQKSSLLTVHKAFIFMFLEQIGRRQIGCCCSIDHRAEFRRCTKWSLTARFFFLTSRRLIGNREASHHLWVVVRGSYLSLRKSSRTLGAMGVSPSQLGELTVEGGGEEVPVKGTVQRDFFTLIF